LNTENITKKSLYFHIKRQLKVLNYEAKNLKRAINYYIVENDINKIDEYNKRLDNYEVSINDEKGYNQFQADLLSIKKGLDNYIDTKLENILINFESFPNNLAQDNANKENSYKETYELYELSNIRFIPLIDCLMNEVTRLSYELNYYSKAYKTLLDNKSFIYITSPVTNRRIRSSNIILLLNNMAKKYHYELYQFYQKTNLLDKNNTNNKVKDIITTLNHNNAHYRHDFSTNENEYIYMSYFYLDKPIIQNIMLHEMAHGMYLDKLSEYEIDKIYADIFYNSLDDSHILEKDFLMKLYEEILSDMGALYISSKSYILSLFHIGFFKDVSLNFYPHVDYRYEYKIDDDNFKNPTLSCRAREEKASLLSWDFNPHLVAMCVRYLLLIRIYDYFYPNEKDEFIDGILELIYDLFPKNEQLNKGKKTFESILNNNTILYNNYEASRKMVHYLVNTFYEKILTNQFSKTFRKSSKSNEKKEQLQNIFDWIGTDKLHITPKDINNGILKYHSYFDLLWLKRFYKLKNNIALEDAATVNVLHYFYDKYIEIKDSTLLKKMQTIFQDYNPEESLKILINKEKTDKEKIYFQDAFNKKQLQKLLDKNLKQDNTILNFYELVFLKHNLTSGQQPFIDCQDSTTYKEIEDSLDTSVKYVFGPYDIAFFSKTILQEDSNNERKSIDDILEKNSKNGLTFYTDRHSLLKILSYNSDITPTRNSIIDNILLIKINKMQNQSSTIYDLYKYLTQNKISFDFYYSLGGESFVIHCKNLILNNLEITSRKVKTTFKAIFLEVESHIVLNHKFTKNKNTNFLLHNITSPKYQIVMFMKINPYSEEASNFYSALDAYQNINNSKIDHNELRSIIKYLPSIKTKKTRTFYNIKIPSSRHDLIVNWKITNSTLTNIQSYLKKLQTIDKSLVQDFYIDLMQDIYTPNLLEKLS